MYYPIYIIGAVMLGRLHAPAGNKKRFECLCKTLVLVCLSRVPRLKLLHYYGATIDTVRIDKTWTKMY